MVGFIKQMGKHNKKSRHNYLKRRQKALKKRENVQEFSLVQCQAEDQCIPNEEDPRTSEETSERCNKAYSLSRYRTHGDLPPELQFNPMKDHLYSSFIKYFKNKRKLQGLLKNPLGQQ